MKAVIFDFNGTLFLDNDKHIQAWSEIARELRGTPITATELHENMNGCPNAQIVRYLKNGEVNEELENEYSERKEALYRQFCKADQPRFHLIEGATELFDDLKAREIPFTIASASIKSNIDFFVESFNLDHWIDPDMIVYDDGTYENKEAMFMQAARNLNVPIEDVTVIEDSLAGVRSAVADGITDIRIINSGNIADAVKDIPAVHQILDDMTGIER